MASIVPRVLGENLAIVSRSTCRIAVAGRAVRQATSTAEPGGSTCSLPRPESSPVAAYWAASARIQPHQGQRGDPAGSPAGTCPSTAPGHPGTRGSAFAWRDRRRRGCRPPGPCSAAKSKSVVGLSREAARRWPACPSALSRSPNFSMTRATSNSCCPRSLGWASGLSRKAMTRSQRPCRSCRGGSGIRPATAPCRRSYGRSPFLRLHFCSVSLSSSPRSEPIVGVVELLLVQERIDVEDEERGLHRAFLCAQHALHAFVVIGPIALLQVQLGQSESSRRAWRRRPAPGLPWPGWRRRSFPCGGRR